MLYDGGRAAQIRPVFDLHEGPYRDLLDVAILSTLFNARTVPGVPAR
jgi:hypothetical protein